MKKVLITGGSGMLGANLAQAFADRFLTVITHQRHPVLINNCLSLALDLTDAAEKSKILALAPDLIIHTAALTDVDFCESHPGEAWKANVEVTRNLAEVAAAVQAKMMYISTDFVFDGKKGHYRETDQTHPLSVYADTKLMGEKAVIDLCPDHLIARTTIYGWNIQPKPSLADWIINSVKLYKEVNLFSDQFFTPILVNNLGEALLEMCELDLHGVYHVAGSERCSKFTFGLAVAEVFNLDPRCIHPIAMDDLKLKARRPADASLDVRKAQKALLETKLLGVKEGLECMKELLTSGQVAELKAGYKGDR